MTLAILAAFTLGALLVALMVLDLHTTVKQLDQHRRHTK